MNAVPYTNLKLRHFRLVAAIAAHGQLSPAAAALSMTQPAASRMLTEIEHLIGATLFERRARGMHLTDIGQVVARHADALIGELRETMLEVEEFKRGQGGRVRVGAVTGAAVGYVMPAILELKKSAPGADIHIDVAASDGLIRDLVAGNLDLVLGRVPPSFDPRDFAIARGRTETIDLVVRGHHPLADAGTLSLAELTAFEWVMPAAGAPARQAVEDAFLEAGAVLPDSIINTTSLLAMMALLVSSDAIAPLAREVSRLMGSNDGGPGLKALRIREPIVVSPYHLLSLKSRPLSPLAKRLRDLVSHELERQRGEAGL